MIAHRDLHNAHGGLPSHVSQSQSSYIPSFYLSMRWRPEKLLYWVMPEWYKSLRLLRASIVKVTRHSWTILDAF